MLTHFFELRDELKVFFSNHPFELSGYLHDEEYLTCLAYLCDISSRLNKLNLGLQGVSASIFNVQDTNNTKVFPVLHDILCSNDLTLLNTVKRDCNMHLEELAAQLRRYFRRRTGQMIGYVTHSVPCLLRYQRLTRNDLIEIATDGSIKVQYAQNTLANLWTGLCTEWPALAKRAVKTLMPFATTYLSESGFSALTNMKTKYRARLCVENDLRLSLSQIEANIEVCASA